MAKTEKKQKFELATLNANNIVELDGWKEKQNQVVAENPFIEITDRESYETAKSRRTALVSARTEIQKQDKMIGSVVSTFRKSTMAIAKELIEITEPHEQKQQEEVSRYESILEEKRLAKEREEEARIKKINNQIESVKIELKKYVDSMTFPNIKETEGVMKSAVELAREFDYEEYEVMFDEVVNEQFNFYHQHVEILEKEESERLEQIKRDQEAKINELFVQTTRVIDNIMVENYEESKNQIDNLLNVDFDFGDYADQFNQMKSEMETKVSNKLKAVEEEIARRNKIREEENRNRINHVREGLLDKIFQMDVDNFKVESDYVNEALSQENPFPELQEEFDKMISIVKKNLDQKSQMIQTQIDQQKRDEKAEEERMEKVMAERTVLLKSLGMVEIDKDNENFFRGFGLKYDVSEIYEADNMEFIVDEINDMKAQFNEIAKRTEARGKQLEEIGFIKHEQSSENYWEGDVNGQFEVWESMVEGLTDEDWIQYVDNLKDQIKKATEENQALQERKERLKLDKQRMVEFLEEHDNSLMTDYKWENEEMAGLWNQIKYDFVEFTKSRINKINNF